MLGSRTTNIQVREGEKERETADRQRETIKRGYNKRFPWIRAVTAREREIERDDRERL